MLPRRVPLIVSLLLAILLFAGIGTEVFAQDKPAKPTPVASPQIVYVPLPAPSPIPSAPDVEVFGWTWDGVKWKDIAAPMVQVAGGALAGYITLLQFWRTHRQRDEQFDRKELQDQFVDIENRLASTEPIMRANAALRLAEFGKTLKPGARKSVQVTWQFPIPKILIACALNERNNSYFLPSVAQLATALHLEKDANIRATIKEALATLTEFAAKKDKHDILLVQLVHEIADANRAAKRAFIKVLAEYATTTFDITADDMMKLLANAAPFCKIVGDAEQQLADTKSTLHSLIEMIDFSSDKAIYESLRRAQTRDERRKADSELFPKVQNAASVLIDTRDALAIGLKALSIPFGLSTKKLDFKTSIGIQEFCTMWKRLPSLNLSQCFLAGASLRSAHLQGVNLNLSYLQGANFNWVYLQGTSLNRAYLQGANLNSAKLQGGDLRSANLQRASLHWANLQGASLQWARLQGADLRSAHLQGADLRSAYLQGADLCGVYIQKENTNGWRRSDFSQTDWKHAKFFVQKFLQSLEADKRTQELQEWLAETFPYSEKVDSVGEDAGKLAEASQPSLARIGESVATKHDYTIEPEDENS